MKQPIVADSASLIGLERINQLNLLPELFEPILIPPEVAREVRFSFDWLLVDTTFNDPLIASLNLTVDRGEAEAIALAHEKGWRILLDDRRARSVAKQLGLRIIGTVGALILAKQQSIIPALKPLLDALEANSFYLSDDLKQEALSIVKE